MPPVMMNFKENSKYAPVGKGVISSQNFREPFDLEALEVAGVVAVCDVDGVSGEGPAPTMDMSITQFLRMSDQSLIRLDMDRGVRTFMRGVSGDVSWKKSADEVIAEVIALVQDDAGNVSPQTFPWAEYVEAAGKRGVHITESVISELPYRVMFSDSLARLFEF